MKAGRTIAFHDIDEPAQAARHVIRVRFAEALEQQHALDGDDNDAIHAFRLACKRLRYAIERFQPPGLQPTADALKAVTDELGSAHDCVVLARRASDCGCDAVALRALRDRDRCVQRGIKRWRESFAKSGAFARLAEYAGFQWSAR